MPILKTFLRLPTLIVLSASAVTAMVTGQWWIVGMGFLAAAAMYAQTLLSRRGQGAAHAESARVDSPPECPQDAHKYDLDRLNPRVRENFQAILGKQAKIMEALGAQREDSIVEVGPLGTQVEELTAACYRSFVKLNKLTPFIGSDRVRSVENRIKDMHARLDSAGDDKVMRENLSMAIKNLSDERDSLRELRRERERIVSQLMNAEAALDSIHLSVVKLGLDPHALDAAVDQIHDQVRRLTFGVASTERLVDELKQVAQQSGREYL